MRRRWLFAWTGAALIGIANGALREATYGRRTSERPAQRISTLTLLAGLGGYFRALQRRWPIPTDADAARIGASWVALTVGFEFGFGHWVSKDPWSELLAAYDVTEGSWWPLVPAWMAVGPALARRLPLGGSPPG